MRVSQRQNATSSQQLVLERYSHYAMARQELGQASRELQLLLLSGLSISRALEVVSARHSPLDSAVFELIGDLVDQGHYLSNALSRFPATFSLVYRAIVEVGESTGRLPEVLGVLADWLQIENDNLRKVKGALAYPGVVVGVTLLLAALLFTTVLPVFQELFEGQPLPLLTRAVLFLAHLAVSPAAWVGLLVVAALVWRQVKNYEKTLDGQCKLYRWILFLPGIGQVLTALAHMRYASALAMTSNFGVKITASLDLAGRASGSPLILQDTTRLKGIVTSGESLSAAYKTRPDLYPSIFSQMVQVGEENGNWGSQFQYLARTFAVLLDEKLDLLKVLLEPVLIAFVSGLVVTIVLSVYLPLYGVLQNISN